tara:strand:- start:21 stop:215 length:195 start_codon:yes stop_codon:yes gene_type:complete
MPNQRDERKKSLSAYIWETDKEVLAQVAKDNDMNMTELIEYLVNELKEESDTITRENIKKWKNK